MLEGRGLFYGAAAPGGGLRIFTAVQWDAACQQAKAWGIQIVSPKVADGPYGWYDSHGLQMLLDTARHYGLRVAPYQYWWGNKYPYGNNPNRLLEEVTLAASLANFFGAICPDIESEWDNQRQWAVTAGQIFRKAAPHAEVYPTLFANPSGHPTPYAELMPWIDGWMPMMYFDLWTHAGHPMTALEAIDWMFHGEWSPLNQHLIANHIPTRPILPIIEVGNHLPASEVTTFYEKMQDFGCISVWHDGVYPPYAGTIQAAPQPAFKTTPPVQPPIAPPPPVVIPPVAPPSPVVLPPVLPPTQPDPVFVEPVPATGGLSPVADGQGKYVLRQELTEAELRVLWHRKSPSVPWDPKRALCAVWIWLIQNMPALYIGSPLSDEIGSTIDGQDIITLPLSSGRELVQYKASGHIALV